MGIGTATGTNTGTATGTGCANTIGATVVNVEPKNPLNVLIICGNATMLIR
jgi:hypothetical protein